MARTRSTTEIVLKGPFKAHGEIKYKTEGRMLLTKATGPFNTEIVSAIPLAIQEMVAKLVRQGKWGQIIAFQKSALCSPSAIDNFAAYLKRTYTNPDTNPVVALVFAREVEGGLLMAPKFEKCYQDAGVQCDSFEDYATAFNWVESKISQTSKKIVWRDSYKIGDATIDEQHQEIFTRAADVVAAATRDAQLECATRLQQFALMHFSHEEDLMHRLQYTRTEAHVQQHLDLIERLDRISKNIADESLNKSELEEFIAHWLLTHIASEDAKLTGFLNLNR